MYDPFRSWKKNLNTTTQDGIRHDVHPLTNRYKTDITHGYNARRLNKTIYFDTLFPKFRSLNRNICAQLLTDTELIILYFSQSKAEAGNGLNDFIDDIGIPMNMHFYHAVEFLGEWIELTNSKKKHSLYWNINKHYSHWHNQTEIGIK